MNVEIGGGKRAVPGWRNFDQRQGFRLDKATSFPVDSAELIYSSHCFEHLNDETVDRMLSEARRLGGVLVLKLPDFEEVLKRWRACDDAYFRRWGQDKVVPTWKSRGVEDSIDARAAMIFCGWWNLEYGDEWCTRTPGAADAYHGPAVMARKAFREVLGGGFSPMEIADLFVEHVMAFETGYTFNHRNAWSRLELLELLGRHGFDEFCMKVDEICAMPIPGIRDQREISMYVRCR